MRKVDKHRVRMHEIETVAAEALLRAYEQRQEIGGAVNWADLHVVDVQRIESLHGDRFYRVVIEEADADATDLQAFVWNALHAAKLTSPDGIEVATEW